MTDKFRYGAWARNDAEGVYVARILGDTITEVPLSHPDKAASVDVAWSPNGKYLLVLKSGAGTERLYGYKVEGGDFVALRASANFTGLAGSYTPSRIAWHPNSQYAFLLAFDGIRVISVGSDDIFTIGALVANAGNKNCVDVSADGTKIAVGSGSSSTPLVWKFDAGTLTALTVADGAAGQINACSFSSDGKWLALGTGAAPNIVYYSIAGDTFTLKTGAPTVGTTTETLTFLRDSLVIVLTVATASPIRLLRIVNGTLTQSFSTAGAFQRGQQGRSRNLKDGKHIAIPHWNATANTGGAGIYEINSGYDTIARIAALSFTTFVPTSVDFSPEFVPEVATHLFDVGLYRMTSGAANLGALKLLFVSAAYSFDPAATTLAGAVGSNEVHGMDWPEGGVALSNARFTQGAGASAGFTFDLPPTTMSSPGTMTVHGAIIYDGSTAAKEPLVYLPLPEAKTVVQYDSITFQAPTGRVLTFTPE